MNVTRNAHAVLLIAAGLVLGTLTTTACGADDPANAPSASSTAAASSSTSTSSAPELNGTYKATDETMGGTSTWTVTPCGEGCANIAVKSETANNFGDTLALPFTGQAHLKTDEWSMAVIRTDGYTCDDGTYVAVDAIYSWNTTTLKGSWDATLHEPGCGRPAGFGTGPSESFTLTKASDDEDQHSF